MSAPSGVFLVAGEPSGDAHAAEVLRALKREAPNMRARGLGGPLLERAGMQLHEDLASDAIMGIFPVIKAFPKIRRIFHEALRSLTTDPPEALVLVDYPGFNIRLAERAHGLGIPVIYYISPQVWAWARWRVKKLARIVDLMLVILPFEEAVYRESGLRAEYVGHPLADHLERHPPRKDVLASLERERFGQGPLVGVFPGSRGHVIDSLLPVFAAAARRISADPLAGNPRFVIALAQERFRERVTRVLGDDPRFLVVVDASQEVMVAADVCMTSSGTTTLEIAGRGTPFVIGYKVSPVFYGIGRAVVAVEHIGLVNLVAGRRVVPEFVDFRSFSRPLADAVLELLTVAEARSAQEASLAEVRRALGGAGSYDRAAGAILRFLAERRTPAP